jgi:prepilin peptidase CpaA
VDRNERPDVGEGEVLHKLPWLLAIVFSAVAGWRDWQTRRIPNWLTVTGLFVGLAVNTAIGGWPGARAALEGAGLGLAVLLPFVLLRGLGAGDWKLAGGLGAFVGPARIFEILVIAVFVAGAMAIFEALRRHRMLATMRNLWTLVQGFFVFGLRPNSEISLENPALIKLPFAVAVAAATVISFSFTGIIF